MKKLTILILMFLTILICADELTATAKNALSIPKSGELKKNGVIPFLSASSNFLLNDNRSFIGQEDGSVITFGLSLKGNLDLFYNNHDLRLAMDVIEQFSRTPILDRFTKTTDNLKLEISYLYHISSIWGPYAKGTFETSILPSYYETVEEQTYQKPDFSTKRTNSMQIVPSLKPITIKESLGLFYSPLKRKEITLETKGGFGALHTMASGAYFIDDDVATTNTIELSEFKSFNQAGASLSLNLNGSIEAKSVITYDLKFEMLTPFIYDDSENRGSWELTNYDTSLTLSTQLTSWLSINYQLKLIKQPQLLDEWQVQNNVSLSLNYLLIGKK
ncbi:hypothetical protein JXR93_09230 [bacterium]|nr:hypothetical protein [bacterium]